MHSKVLELELPAHRSRDKSMRLVVMVEGGMGGMLLHQRFHTLVLMRYRLFPNPLRFQF
jgi:hypothetical protein